MAITNYTRSKGEMLTYEIRFDEDGYEVRRDGEVLAKGGVDLAGRRTDLPGVAQTAQLEGAKFAIEELMGLSHE